MASNRVNYTNALVTDTSPTRPFDERAALQELERLAEKIQSTRRQRQQSVAEFESFVKAFRDDRYREVMAASAPAARPSDSPPTVERRVADARVTDAPVTPLVQPASDVAPPVVVQPVAHQSTGSSGWLASRPSDQRLALAGLGVLALVALVMWLWGGSGSPATPPAAAVPAAGTEPAPAAPAAAPQPVASTGPARALNVELITIRPVWTRAVVDGEKVIERELPKDSRISLSADRAIVIRAGDAGGMRLIVNGRDEGIIGRNGQTVTRTLTAPPNSPR